MKKLIPALLLLVLLSPKNSQAELSKSSLNRCKQVVANYCRAVDEVESDDDGDFTVHLVTGKSISCDDHKNFDLHNSEDYQKQLELVALSDILQQPYRTGNTANAVSEKNYDPGRFRNDDLSRAMYGQTKEEIAANLVPVVWREQKILFNKRNGAAAALQAVFNEIESNPETAAWLNNREYSGAFVYRPIAGTQRLSSHSFGTAIDFTIRKGEPARDMYWKWNARCADGIKCNPSDATEAELDLMPAQHFDSFPQAVVNIFEKHGFIWGGRWYHYDTMHFEYRPEFFGLPQKSCAHLNDFE